MLLKLFLIFLLNFQAEWIPVHGNIAWHGWTKHMCTCIYVCVSPGDNAHFWILRLFQVSKSWWGWTCSWKNVDIKMEYISLVLQFMCAGIFGVLFWGKIVMKFCWERIYVTCARKVIQTSGNAGTKLSWIIYFSHTGRQDLRIATYYLWCWTG